MAIREAGEVRDGRTCAAIDHVVDALVAVDLAAAEGVVSNAEPLVLAIVVMIVSAPSFVAVGGIRQQVGEVFGRILEQGGINPDLQLKTLRAVLTLISLSEGEGVSRQIAPHPGQVLSKSSY